ncbi:MAG: VOC family protein [Pikeienuella sp.]|uniref:VOC family protein n=1 Tax=Pikeienuella sp. TaxID=2831957 RepID=UPI00391AB151
MSWSIHHVNLEAKDVRRSAAFYAAVLGMEEGKWAFPESRGYIPGAPDRLALFPDGRQSHTGLHLIKGDPDFAARNGFRHNPSLGGHFAIEVDDLRVVMRRLDEAGIPYSDGGVFAIPNLHNIYFEDPDGNLIEVNQRV